MTDSPSRTRTFEMSLPIAAPRQAVWQAISEARELMRWFAPRAEVDPGEGGRVLWQWREHHTWPQTIDIWEPGQHLRTRYDSAVDDGQGGKRPLFVDFHLEGDGGTTTLRLVHSGFGPEASFDQEYDGISAGWPVELRSLRLYLERHRGQDRQLAWTTKSVGVSAESAWKRLTGPGGIDVAALAGSAEGTPLSVEIPGAGRIEGTVLFAPQQREISALAKNLGDGWFRVHCERWGGTTNIWLWLALYEKAPQRAAAFQRAFDGLLDRLFPAAAAATATEGSA